MSTSERSQALTVNRRRCSSRTSSLPSCPAAPKTTARLLIENYHSKPNRVGRRPAKKRGVGDVALGAIPGADREPATVQFADQLIAKLSRGSEDYRASAHRKLP